MNTVSLYKYQSIFFKQKETMISWLQQNLLGSTAYDVTMGRHLNFFCDLRSQSLNYRFVELNILAGSIINLLFLLLESVVHYNGLHLIQ